MKKIFCPVCGDECGKEYPDTYDDPGFREGKGENFANNEGIWFCSQSCLDEDLKDKED